MADDMQVDPVLPPREPGRSQSPTKVQMTSGTMLQSIREEIVQSVLQLGPGLFNGLREALREEVQGLRGSTEVGRSHEDPRGRVQALLTEIVELNTKNTKLQNQNLKQEQDMKDMEAAMIQRSKDSDFKMKKLHQIIIESGQNSYAPDDDFVTSEFTSLNNSIMRIVKKHYTYPVKSLSKPAKWRYYVEYSPENRELFLRSLIAERLYKSFHAPEAGIYGLDKDTDAEMADFERTMRKSGKVAEPDILDWRVCTVSIAKSFDDPKRLQLAHVVARELCNDILFAHNTIKPTEENDAKNMMMDICERSLELALLFKRTKTTFMWEQIQTPMDVSEMEIIGSLSGRQPLSSEMKISRIVFGSVVKRANSHEGERAVLRKAEVLMC